MRQPIPTAGVGLRILLGACSPAATIDVMNLGSAENGCLSLVVQGIEDGVMGPSVMGLSTSPEELTQGIIQLAGQLAKQACPQGEITTEEIARAINPRLCQTPPPQSPPTQSAWAP